ncbi:MAG: 3-alpha,7-alpha,12-alpha-trihydroxy-5-beta-cholest-24-enoyl-CoA hydratase [Chloroflexi bacterium]|nr:3-alpha,7-alpha,12-alpha-trihydroxy-5-beta-cholest-24-enoyl-CoA hydratase [Chloroflexota bacterium]
MAVDLSKALGYCFEPAEFKYDEGDVSLYGLSIGAAADPTDPEELKYVYELNGSGFTPFPTFPVVLPFANMWEILNVPGLEFNPMMLLHGEHYMEVKRPLPTAATLTNHTHISQIYDKGSGALIILDISSVDEQGNEIAFNQLSAFIRGIGSFGGERGPSQQINLPPDRPPDAVSEQPTQPNQALLYRLSSRDANPLHADPQMAAVGGYERPILHGLCTFGFAARAVLKQFGENDPARLKSVKVRFNKHFFPGETAVTEMWSQPDGRILFQTKVKERDIMVLSHAAVILGGE